MERKKELSREDLGRLLDEDDRRVQPNSTTQCTTTATKTTTTTTTSISRSPYQNTDLRNLGFWTRPYNYNRVAELRGAAYKPEYTPLYLQSCRYPTVSEESSRLHGESEQFVVSIDGAGDNSLPNSPCNIWAPLNGNYSNNQNHFDYWNSRLAGTGAGDPGSVGPSSHWPQDNNVTYPGNVVNTFQDTNNAHAQNNWQLQNAYNPNYATTNNPYALGDFSGNWQPDVVANYYPNVPNAESAGMYNQPPNPGDNWGQGYNMNAMYPNMQNGPTTQGNIDLKQLQQELQNLCTKYNIPESTTMAPRDQAQYMFANNQYEYYDTRNMPSTSTDVRHQGLGQFEMMPNTSNPVYQPCEDVYNTLSAQQMNYSSMGVVNQPLAYPDYTYLQNVGPGPTMTHYNQFTQTQNTISNVVYDQNSQFSAQNYNYQMPNYENFPSTSTSHREATNMDQMVPSSSKETEHFPSLLDTMKTRQSYKANEYEMNNDESNDVASPSTTGATQSSTPKSEKSKKRRAKRSRKKKATKKLEKAKKEITIKDLIVTKKRKKEK